MMKGKTLALCLLVVFVAFGNASLASAQQIKVIRLSAEGDGSKVTTIHVNDQYLLAEFDPDSESFLVRDDAVVTINRKDKTYKVKSYEDLLTAVKRNAAQSSQLQPYSAVGQGVELKLTGETGTISGIKVRKLVKTNKGQPEAEYWVSEELLPAKLRVIGNNLRSTLGDDYWRRVHGNPGMIELVMLYGIPLKMISDHKTFVATIVPASSPGFSFEVPGDYKKLDN